MGSTEERSREENSSQALGGIEKQSCNSECWRLAGHIRRPNIAAAARSYVLTFEDPHQQVAKRDRSQQVAEGGRDEIRNSCSSHLAKCSAGRPRPAELETPLL